MAFITETPNDLRELKSNSVYENRIYKQEATFYKPSSINNYKSSFLTEIQEKYLYCQPNSALITTLGEIPKNMVDDTFSSILWANELFKDSKPMDDMGLEVLNKTFKRLLKKTPTRL